jgi:hypothetical protein
MKALKIAAFALVTVALLGALAYGGVKTFVKPEPAIVQPIAFDHSKHTGDGEKSPKLACTECHTGANKTAVAGFPSLDKCLQCHMKPQSDSDAERAVRDAAQKGGSFAWIQVTQNAGHVYFSHRAHVVTVGLGCVECHGDVTAWSAPPERPEARLKSMDACTDCHRRRGGSMNCLTCHK